MNKVTLPYDLVWTPLEWAKEHCPSYITNELTPLKSGELRGVTIDYFFSEERDAIWFALRWSGE